MSCCKNPNIQSSTYSDWCVNCGWSYSYLNDSSNENEDLSDDDSGD